MSVDPRLRVIEANIRKDAQRMTRSARIAKRLTRVVWALFALFLGLSIAALVHRP